MKLLLCKPTRKRTWQVKVVFEDGHSIVDVRAPADTPEGEVLELGRAAVLPTSAFYAEVVR